MGKLGLTGVTGNLGRSVAESVKDQGSNLVLIARSPERAPQIEGAEVRKASYELSDESVAALQGVDVLFMVSGKENAHRREQHLDFLEAAHKAGVRHIVYTSFYNPAEDCTFTLGRDHYATEERIKELGITYTFIRDNFYIDFFVDMMKEYKELRGPAENGRCSCVLRSDVAGVISTILQDPSKYENRVLNMTGSKAYTLQEMADLASRIWNQEITYHNETVEEAYESRKKWKAEAWEYDSWVTTYTAIAKGELEGVSTDIQDVTGKAPTTLEEYLERVK